MTLDAPLRFGIVTPIVTLRGRSDSWEADGGPEELGEIAKAADRLDYFYLTCSEHVGIPTDVAPIRGARYYDPLATFGFMAALTERIRFFTNVIVLPYNHPLAIAKRYGTLDRICDGRLMFGVGVGSLREEFELLGAEFERRGDSYADAIAALRASFGVRDPSYAGTHYRFEDFIIDPCGVQRDVPIWLGGRTARSLRRALESGDGWNPFSLGITEVGEMLARARDLPAWKDRVERGDAPLEVALAPGAPVDVCQAGHIDKMIDGVARARAAGATVINVGVHSDSLAHYLDQLEIIHDRVMPRFA